MPQLDFHNPLTTSNVVWMLIIFTVLYLLLSRWALPQIGAVKEKRVVTIGAELDAARVAKEKSDAAVAELEIATRSAQAEAQAAISGAVESAKQEAAAQSAVLNARIEAQLAAAETQINQARTAALGALREVATETAGVIIARLTGQPGNPAALTGAISHAMTARGQA